MNLCPALKLSKAEKISLAIFLFCIITLPLAVIVVQYRAYQRSQAFEVQPSQLPLLQTSSAFDRAIRFNQNNEGVVVDNSQPFELQTFTAEAWAKWEGGSDQAGQFIFRKRLRADLPYNDSYSIFIDPLGADPSRQLKTRFSPESGTVLISTENLLKDQQWHHLAVVASFDASEHLTTIKFYVDGVEKGEPIYTHTPLIYRGGLLYFGIDGYGSGDDRSFFGQIDELRISRVARYTSNFTPPSGPFNPDGNTVGLWHFDGDVQDVSGNGNHGRIIGEVEFVSGVITPTPTPGGPTPTPYSTQCPLSSASTAFATYYGFVYIQGLLAPSGTSVKIYGPHDDVVGCGLTEADGILPYTRAYGIIDGIAILQDNDPLIFKINDSLAQSQPSPILFHLGAMQLVNLFLGSLPISPTPTPTPTPATPCPSHNLPASCSASIVCAILDCFGTQSGGSQWTSCKQYDFNGDCLVDIVDFSLCRTKAPVIGQEGQLCHRSSDCRSGFVCQTACTTNAGSSIGECVSP